MTIRNMTTGNTARRFWATMAFCSLIALLPCSAQSGMRINDLFEGKVVPAENMVKTRIRGKSLSKYKLTFFHSVRFKADETLARRIDHMAAEDFAADSEKFKHREPYSSGTGRVVNKKVAVFTQMYELAPQGNTRRYLCYKKMGDVMTVIYIEGSLTSLEELKKIFKE